eukprot:scaffold4064_cov355-Prasinococcus_capsulatus_cf.AAC.2
MRRRDPPPHREPATAPASAYAASPGRARRPRSEAAGTSRPLPPTQRRRCAPATWSHRDTGRDSPDCCCCRRAVPLRALQPPTIRPTTGRRISDQGKQSPSQSAAQRGRLAGPHQGISHAAWQNSWCAYRWGRAAN